MAKEYIERDVAIEKTEAFCDVFVTQWTDEKVLAWIRNLPTADVVEVVRCKDCVYSKNYSCTRGEMYDDTRYIPDYFCADGERRDNNAAD